MKRIVIVGGGGLGLELYSYIAADLASGGLAGYALGGVLDDGADCELLRKIPSATWLGPIRDYLPQGDEVALIAVGNARNRSLLAQVLRDRGLPLFTYVHPDARVAPSATLGQGVIVAPYCLVNAGASVGDNVMINMFCALAHGSSVGAHSVLSPYCALSGDAALGERCFLGTRATVFPKVRLGNACVVDAHTAVRHSLPDKKMVSVRGEYAVVDNRLDRF